MTARKDPEGAAVDTTTPFNEAESSIHMHNMQPGPSSGVDPGPVPGAEIAPTDAEIARIAEAIARRDAVEDALDAVQALLYEACERVDVAVACTRRGNVIRPRLFVVDGLLVLADERPGCVAVKRRGGRCGVYLDFGITSSAEGYAHWVPKGQEEQFLAQTCRYHADGSAASYLPVEWTPVPTGDTREAAQ